MSGDMPASHSCAPTAGTKTKNSPARTAARSENVIRRGAKPPGNSARGGKRGTAHRNGDAAPLESARMV